MGKIKNCESENIYSVNFSLLTGSCQYDTFSSMSKKKRTRKEKVIANLKRQLLKKENSSQKPLLSKEPNNEYAVNFKFSAPLEFKKNAPVNANNPYIKHTQKDYSYVIPDMRNTGIVMVIILAVNLAVSIMFKKGILNLKFL